MERRLHNVKSCGQLLGGLLVAIAGAALITGGAVMLPGGADGRFKASDNRRAMRCCEARERVNGYPRASTQLGRAQRARQRRH